MKYLFSIVCLLLLLANTADAQNNVNWMSWEEAMTAAETSPKKIYIDVYTDWCGYCKKMDKTTFKDPKVVEFLNDNFYPVKFNAEQKEKINFNNTEFGYIAGGQRGVHELAYALLNGRLGYPAFVILDEEFARILISPGFKGPDAVMMEMEFAKEEKYKTMAWTNFQTEYKNKLRSASMQNPNANAAKPSPKVNAAKPSPKVNVKQAENKTNVNVSSKNRTKVDNRSAKMDTIPRGGTPPPPPPPPPAEAEVYKVVEEMPRFPGCEDKELSKAEKTKCAQDLMLQYIYKNLKYPEEARAKKTDGMVVLQFVIDENGAVGKTKIVRDIGNGCGEAALAVVNSMPNWVPGKQRGKPVNVLYTLPVRFKLENDALDKMKTPKANSDIPPPPPPTHPDESHLEIFKVVENMPRFSGCEDMEGSIEDIRDCAEQKMLDFIYDNLEYPKVARENGVEGMTVLQFVVGTKGQLSNIKVIRDIGGECGQAALDVINKMPDWVPGTQRGRAVPVLYTLPVRFKLEKEKKDKK